MRSILGSLAEFYLYFVDNNEISISKIEIALKNLSDIEKRAEFIRDLYEILLNEKGLNWSSRMKIKTDKNYEWIANYFNVQNSEEIKKTIEREKNGIKVEDGVYEKTLANVRGDIYYSNKKLSELLNYTVGGVEKDWFSTIMSEEMDEVSWKMADKALDKVRTKVLGVSISKDKFWLNVPTKYFNYELSEEEFNDLINLIKPYFATQKKLAQLKLNSMKTSCGYLNYILNDGSRLKGIDLQRRNLILGLMDNKKVNEVKEAEANEKAIETSEIKKIQSEIEEMQARLNTSKELRTEIMSKIGFIYYKANMTGSGLNADLDNTVKKFTQQYNNELSASKQMEQSLKEKEEMIEHLRETEKLKQEVQEGIKVDYDLKDDDTIKLDNSTSTEVKSSRVQVDF